MVTVCEKFPKAFNSLIRAKMGLSPFENVFGSKPGKPNVFNLSSTTDNMRNRKTTENSPCNFLPIRTHRIFWPPSTHYEVAKRSFIILVP